MTRLARFDDAELKGFGTLRISEKGDSARRSDTVALPRNLLLAHAPTLRNAISTVTLSSMFTLKSNT